MKVEHHHDLRTCCRVGGGGRREGLHVAKIDLARIADGKVPEGHGRIDLRRSVTRIDHQSVGHLERHGHVELEKRGRIKAVAKWHHIDTHRPLTAVTIGAEIDHQGRQRKGITGIKNLGRIRGGKACRYEGKLSAMLCMFE